MILLLEAQILLHVVLHILLVSHEVLVRLLLHLHDIDAVGFRGKHLVKLNNGLPHVVVILREAQEVNFTSVEDRLNPCLHRLHLGYPRIVAQLILQAQ